MDGLWAGLERLDRRLAAAVEAADRAYGREAQGDRFRGLHIGPADVERMLARAAGAPLLSRPLTDAAAEAEATPSRLDWLADSVRLSTFDCDVILLALAPEIDLRYERLYAYLQDDVTRRRPSVDLALNLLCGDKEEKLARRSHFAADAPLLRHDVVRLTADPVAPHLPLLAHSVVLDEQIVRFLLEDGGLDSRLAGFVDDTDVAGLIEDTKLARGLAGLGERRLQRGGALRVHLHGADATRRRLAAQAVADAAGERLLALDFGRGPADEIERAWGLALREARLGGTALFVEGCSRLWDGPAAEAWSRAARSLGAHEGLVVLGSAGPPPRALPPVAGPLGIFSLALPPAPESERRRHWEAGLAAAGIALAADAVDALADRFRLTVGEIEEVATAADAAAAMDGGAAGAEHVFGAARDRSAWEVQGLVRRISPRRRLEEIVVPDDTRAQLLELCARTRLGRRVLGDWGFAGRLSLGRGTTALFAGPSGAGKTMAAEAIAAALGLDLYRVELAGVVSKWIGETEKNLDRIFRAAEEGSGVLFFDEADALFGKRSEVRDSHDRYANVEISYLLQRMEEHEGVAILATNLRANLDDAFIRRLSFVVHFPFPDESGRRRIWQDIWPGALPMEGLDLEQLARELPLTGGHIRNVALAAAYLAADDGGVVRMDHVHHALRREFQKMGKQTGLAAPAGTRAS